MVSTAIQGVNERYRILRRLASGGMGEVFLADALGAHGVVKRVAIKRILPRAGERGKTALVEEARTALALSHANIVQVFDFGVLGDEHVLVMEYVDGIDLQRLLGALPSERLSVEIAIYVAIETLEGLSHAQGRVDDAGHPLGIVHCDIKPSNLLCSRDGEVKIADFGIAKAAFQAYDPKAHRLAGTAGYMSPEQAWGEPVDSRADVFSVGAVLYRALAGVTPYDARSFTAVRMNVDDARLAPLAREIGAPAALDQVLKRALARDRSDRFATPGAMLGALEDLAHREGILLSARPLAALVRAEVDGSPDAGGTEGRAGPAAGGAMRAPGGLDGIVRQRARAVVGAGSTEQFSEGTNIVLSRIEDGTVQVMIVDPIPSEARRNERRVIHSPVASGGSGAAGGPPGVVPGQPDARPAPQRLARRWVVLAVVFGALSGTLAAVATRVVRERAPDPLAPTIVALSTTPSGASLEIDGRPIGRSPSLAEVSPGTHRVRATHPGFVAVDRSIRVSRGSRLAVHVPLSPEPTAPSTAETPAPLAADSAAPSEPQPPRPVRHRSGEVGGPPDERSESGRADADSLRGSERGVRGGQWPTRSNDIPGRSGTLSVSSEPWARITIDGRPTGLTTPAAGIRLPAGTHTVELYNSVVGARKRFTVRIAPGENLRRMIDLR